MANECYQYTTLEIYIQVNRLYKTFLLLYTSSHPLFQIVTMRFTKNTFFLTSMRL